MPTYLSPGVYVEEISTGARPIEAVGTSTAGFVGAAPNAKAFENQLRWLDNWSQFVRDFVPEGATTTPLANAVYGFFLNGGSRCCVVNVGAGPLVGPPTGRRKGLDLLEETDEVAIVAAPGFNDPASHDALLTHCEKRKNRVHPIIVAPQDRDYSQVTENRHPGQNSNAHKIQVVSISEHAHPAPASMNVRGFQVLFNTEMPILGYFTYGNIRFYDSKHIQSQGHEDQCQTDEHALFQKICVDQLFRACLQ